MGVCSLCFRTEQFITVHYIFTGYYGSEKWPLTLRSVRDSCWLFDKEYTACSAHRQTYVFFMSHENHDLGRVHVSMALCSRRVFDMNSNLSVCLCTVWFTVIANSVASHWGRFVGEGTRTQSRHLCYDDPYWRLTPQHFVFKTNSFSIQITTHSTDDAFRNQLKTVSIIAMSKW